MGSQEQLKGKVCVVTGSTNGIGQAVAGALAKEGARVVVIARDREKGRATVETLRRESGNDAIELALADLLSLSSVRSLADDLLSRFPRIDVLVNNAGGAFGQRTVSRDGLESTLALNVVAAQLLTERLIGALESSGRGRVINVTTGVPKGAKLDLADLQSGKSYSMMGAYTRAKLAVIMLTLEQAKRHSGVSFNAVHPGIILGTNFGSEMPAILRKVMPAIARLLRLNIPIEQAVAKYVYLAGSSEVEGKSGKLFVDNREQPPPKQALDESVRASLWSELERLTSLQSKAA